MRDLVTPREPYFQSQHSNMNKKSNLTTTVAILLSLAILGTAACFVIGYAYRPYVAVYLSTGDIYYGKLSYFPTLKLINPWFIQKTQDGQLALSRFSDAVWKPESEIVIARDKVVFIAKLDKTSPVIDAIDGKQSAVQQQQQGQQTQPQQQVQQPVQQNQPGTNDGVSNPTKDTTTNTNQPKRN